MIEIATPEGDGRGNHAFVVGLITSAVQLLPGQVPQFVDHVELDPDEGAGYPTTSVVTMSSGNRYRVHVEPLPGNTN